MSGNQDLLIQNENERLRYITVLSHDIIETIEETWEGLSHEEKNHRLYLKQKALLEAFLERRAISKEQYEKSLHDMTEKMGEQ